MEVEVTIVCPCQVKGNDSLPFLSRAVDTGRSGRLSLVTDFKNKRKTSVVINAKR